MRHWLLGSTLTLVGCDLVTAEMWKDKVYYPGDSDDTDDTVDTDDTDDTVDSHGPNDSDAFDDSAEDDTGPGLDTSDTGEPADPCSSTLGCDELLAEGASGLTVGPGGSYNYASIQEAIEAAAEGDIICVAPGTYEENLTLEDKDLRLMSEAGSELTVIQALEAGPVLTIQNTSEATQVQGFTLSGGTGADLSLTEGVEPWWTSRDGSWTLDLVDGTFSNSTVDVCDDDGPYTGGGGLLVISSAPVLTDVNVQGSQACEGGGALLLSSHTASWSCSTIQDNVAGAGGGVSVRDSALTLYQVALYDNGDMDALEEWVWTAGGGVGVWGHSELEAQDVCLEGNVSGMGAGLFADDAQVDWHGGTIVENRAFYGGGMYLEDATLTLSDSEFNANEAWYNGVVGGSGGGILQSSRVQATIERAEFSANLGDGGAICHAGDTTSAEVDALHVVDSWFQENGGSWDGGAISSYYGDELEVDGGVFVENRAERSGGAIYTLNTDQVVITRSLFAGNQAGGRGTVYIWSALDGLSVDHSAFAGNTAGEGGGLYIQETPTELTFVTIARNTAESGGGILLASSALTLLDSVIAFNALSGWDHVGENLGCESSTTSASLAASTTDIYGADASSTVSGCTFNAEADGNWSEDPVFVAFDTDDSYWTWDLHLCTAEACDAPSPLLGGASDGGDPGAYGRVGDTGGPEELSTLAP